jgi:Short C-terminal domain
LVEAGPATSPVEPSLVDEIERLSHLHTAGSLTDEEFTAAKARLLGLA